jgi:hypothetical protein
MRFTAVALFTLVLCGTTVYAAKNGKNNENSNGNSNVNISGNANGNANGSNNSQGDTITDQQGSYNSGNDDGTGGPFRIGEHYSTRVSSNANDSVIIPDQIGKGVQKYTIDHAGASFISVHFANIDLDPSCSMEITDANGDQLTIMHGRGRQSLGTFWARHVEGDVMEITLKCNGANKKAEFVIDNYVAGYPQEFRVPEERKRNLRAPDPFKHLKRDLAICGVVDDKKNAKCYQSTHPTEYNKAKAVARLIINGAWGCTGWLVGPNNMLLTNEHCITSNSDALNTDFQFMYEGGSCTSNSVSGSQTFDGTSLLLDNSNKDYALVQLSGNPISQFG